LGTSAAEAAEHYLDSNGGSDDNSGTKDAPWKSLQKLQGLEFKPGDSVLFKRGSEFAGTVTVEASGEEGNPITFKAYGMGELPRFTNPVYSNNFGRVFDVKGSYVVFEKLLFHDCAVEFDQLRRAHPLGGIFLNEGTHHNIVRGCEFVNMPVGMRDNGDHGVVTECYFHDSSEPLNRYWGPMSVVTNGSYTEISYNRFTNIRSVGTFWGADGGAIEFDDHEHQEGLRVHHNVSRGCSGFLECYEHGHYLDCVIAYNISDDYEKFLGLNGTENWRVENNTVFRTLHDGHGFSDFIWFREWHNPNDVSFANNIFITRDPSMSIFGPTHELRQDGASQKSHHNIYYCYNGEVNVGKPLGEGDRVVDPMFMDLRNLDLRLRSGSPAINAGADTDYAKDVAGIAIAGKTDIGAHEYTDAPRTIALFNGKDLDNWTVFLNDEEGPVEPSDVWQVRDGVIWCSGTPFGYLRTKETYRNFKLTVEWRWPEEPTNSGVFVRIFGEDKQWPLCVEAQLKHGRAGDLIAFNGRLEGAQVRRETLQILQRTGDSNEKKPGEWNTYEITCNHKDIDIETSVNGVPQTRANGSMPFEGSIGLQSEGGPIEFRTVRLQPLD
jgi:hypothetical protein